MIFRKAELNDIKALPAILDEDVSCVPCLDVMNIHVEKLIAMIIDGGSYE